MGHSSRDIYDSNMLSSYSSWYALSLAGGPHRHWPRVHARRFCVLDSRGWGCCLSCPSPAAAAARRSAAMMDVFGRALAGDCAAVSVAWRYSLLCVCVPCVCPCRGRVPNKTVPPVSVQPTRPVVLLYPTPAAASDAAPTRTVRTTHPATPPAGGRLARWTMARGGVAGRRGGRRSAAAAAASQ